MSSDPGEAASLDKGRRLARRRMAYLSFFFLLFTGIVVVVSLVYDSEREAIAAALQGGLGAIAGIIATFTTIILFYLGVSLAERLKGPP